MIKRSLIALLLAITTSYGAVYVVTGRDPQNRGGCWSSLRRTAFTTTMGVSAMDAYAKKNLGANLLALNYYTLVVVDSLDSVYTLGIVDTTDYAYATLFPDSAVSGAGWVKADTTCLYLDGFVTENAQVQMRVNGTAACTLFVTVEQSLRYDTTAADSNFNYGFVCTDTLFSDSLVSTGDSLIVATVSARGTKSRVYSDWFEIVAPCVRFKIFNHGKIATPSLSFELYDRHSNDLMSGTSGRLQEQIK